MQSAATKVLETYELLEAILFDLTARELFVLQGVNSKWRSVIARSEILQTIMFLRPGEAAIRPTGLTTLDAPVYDTHVRLSPACRVAPDPFSDKMASLSSLATWDGEGGYDCPGTTSVHCQPAIRMPELLVSITSGKQSGAAVWKRTLLTQPPIRAVVLCFGRAKGLCTIYNRAGLTLADIFEVKDRVARSSMNDDNLRNPYLSHAYFALTFDLETRMKELRV